MQTLKVWDLTWVRRPCQVAGDEIRSMDGVPGESYNVMNFNGRGGNQALWATFAAINEGDPEAIREFCSQFGFLGIQFSKIIDETGYGRETHRHNSEWQQLSTWFSELTSESNPLIGNLMDLWSKNIPEEAYSISNEGIDDIQKEIRQMRHILEAINVISTRNTAEVGGILDTLLDIIVPEHGSKAEIYRRFAQSGGNTSLGIGEIPPLFLLGKLVTMIINRRLEGITPVLGLSSYNGGFVSGLQSSSLLDSMYLLLYLELMENKAVKKCESETCRQFFPVSLDKMDKKYCSNNCAHAQAAREYRRRKKA